MRITVFTSNQPRHLALIEALAGIAETVYAVQECNTIFPGEVADFFRKSEVMREYFSHVLAAERQVFGQVRFPPPNVNQLSIKMGDLNQLDLSCLGPALESDVYVVFGASYIKGPLCDFLVSHRAYNIHMGVSPYYRGSSTNFWAMYDGRIDYVGATIHLLGRGLDSGPMLFHAFPKAEEMDPFMIGMKAVKAAHAALVARLADASLSKMTPIEQDKSLQLRYTRNQDFTDEVAAEYLRRLPSPADVKRAMERRDMSRFVRPYVG